MSINFFQKKGLIIFVEFDKSRNGGEKKDTSSENLSIADDSDESEKQGIKIKTKTIKKRKSEKK